jgi:hypothetical protein
MYNVVHAFFVHLLRVNNVDICIVGVIQAQIILNLRANNVDNCDGDIVYVIV